MGFSCMDCLRRFSQFLLAVINVLVVILGFATMVIGIYVKVSDKTYFEITSSNSSVAQLSIMLIILGLFIMVVGGVGTAGAIFATNIFGRITLGLYSIILALLIICEVAAGIAAAVERNAIEHFFRDGANDTFVKLNGTGEWGDYEKKLHCCGANSYKDYRTEFTPPRVVPESCCIPAMKDACTEAKRTDPDKNAEVLFSSGCADVVIDGVKHNLGQIAGGGIALGLIEIVGIVLACFVAIYKGQKDKEYEVV